MMMIEGSGRGKREKGGDKMKRNLYVGILFIILPLIGIVLSSPVDMNLSIWAVEAMIYLTLTLVILYGGDDDEMG